MRILITGGFGFIGSRFVEMNSKDKLIILSPTIKKNSRQTKNLFYIKGSVTNNNIDKIFIKYKPDVVVHLAAKSGLSICEKNPSDAFNVNVLGTFNVIKACQKCNSKLIFLSSREVYGEKCAKKTSENEDLIPTNIYGQTKLLAELLIKNAGKITKLDYTILRPTNIYGPGSSKGINQIFRTVLNKRKITVNGGEQLINLIYIDDVIRAIKQSIYNKKSYQQIFNLGTEETFKLKIIAKKISQHLKKVQIEYGKKPQYENKKFIPNNEKIKKILDFKAETRFDQGLKNTIKWFENEK